ncbi:hypothetical protein R1T16_07680 [Flavobacterium sp. DG1-102-2]|uniref:hypothetical protein n=1 Tax=Flavobacterium sp. DG1-102-2 TaxID=3081663 RepID=UPI00294A2944|nr:hypothetical protein [Flavobacterium sp. DG1-102-2]MDV6168302.1 hypothetical protein [Flavobacterium sp. DG1-102-2]
MKKTLLLFALLISGLGFAQSLNDYQYIIVPAKFEWLKEENKFNLNALTKMMFEKQGFQVFYPTDKLPDELALDRCKSLYANVENESNLLTTALTITINTCDGKNVFTSLKGKSKEKTYQKAYYEALREASQSVKQINYKYSGKSTVAVKQSAPVAAGQQAATPVTVNNDNALFAQPIANGYQLVDSTPMIVLKIYKTSQQDSYTAVSENKNGVVFKRGNDWIFEYYQNDKLVSEKLNIKF